MSGTQCLGLNVPDICTLCRMRKKWCLCRIASFSIPNHDSDPQESSLYGPKCICQGVAAPRRETRQVNTVWLQGSFKSSSIQTIYLQGEIVMTFVSDITHIYSSQTTHISETFAYIRWAHMCCSWPYSPLFRITKIIRCTVGHPIFILSKPTVLPY